MEKITSKIKKISDGLFVKQVDVLTWAGVFASVIGFRILTERIFVPLKNPPIEVLTSYLHNLLFFLISYIGIWICLSIVLGYKPYKIAFILLAGSWLIIFPPFFDIAKTGGGTYWSFYILDNILGLFGEFITIFGNLPSGIVYFGTKIVFIIALMGIFGLIYLHTKKISKALFGGLTAYIILFFMSSFPSWIACFYNFFAQSRKITEIQGFQVAQLFGTPAKIFGIVFESLEYSFPYNLNLMYFPILCLLLVGLFLLENKPKSIALVKNARLPQIIGHIGFFAVGMGLGFSAYPERFDLGLFPIFAVLDLILAIILAWIASVIINDVYDFEVDKLSNSERPLPKGVFETKEYLNLGIIIFLLSLLGGLVVSPKFAALLFIYQFIAWVYSSEPFRLKNFPVVATLLGAADLILVMMIGFTLISGDNNIQGLSWRVILYLLIFLTFFLPIKDFKDIEADKKYHTWTLPVIFGEETGRMLLAIWAFISFVASVFFLNEYRLFWWAIIFGSIMFFVLINKKTKPRQFFWWAIIIVGGYGLVLVKIIFL